MTKRDLKYKIKPICEYAMLNGENTDWGNVIESLNSVETEYNPNIGFNTFDDKDFVEVYDNISQAINILYTMGDSNESKIFRLYLISKLYDIVIKWK